jgi:hypothetical protein
MPFGICIPTFKLFLVSAEHTTSVQSAGVTPFNQGFVYPHANLANVGRQDLAGLTRNAPHSFILFSSGRSTVLRKSLARKWISLGGSITQRT